MKIIRHSRKMFVYSLPLLLYLQHLSCNPSALGPTQKTIDQLQAMLVQHGNVGLLIDEMQKEIALVDESSPVLPFFSINYPAARFGQIEKTEKFTKHGLIAKLFEIQKQRMLYDSGFFYRQSANRLKNYNKRLIRNNFIPIITYARTYGLGAHIPMPAIDLPEKPSTLPMLSLITDLQFAISSVTNKQLCIANKSLAAITAELTADHDYFDNRPCCTLYTTQNELNRIIELRTKYIAYLGYAKYQHYKQLQPSSQLTEVALSVPDPNTPPPPYHQGLDPFKKTTDQ